MAAIAPPPHLQAGDRITLIRAENDKSGLANQHVAEAHPHHADRGNLTGDNDGLRLAALVYLSNPVGAELRADSKIKSILATLAGSTDNWVAEAASVAAMR